MNDVRNELLPYVAQAWRHRWHALGTAVAICLLGWTAIAVLPDRYQSSTRIYVDTQSLLSPLMRGMTVDFDLDNQVEIMQRTLLSRPNLEKVMRATDLDLTVGSELEREELLEKMLERTELKIEGDNLFSVAYEAHDPVLAKDVVQALLTIFVESNLGASRRDMQQALEFVESQLRMYEKKLDETEDKLAAFKKANVGYLSPEGDFAAMIDAARQRLAGLNQELSEARIRLQSIEDQMAEIPRYVGRGAALQVILDGNGESRALGIDGRIAELRASLAEMRLRYTERHPDVVLTERRLEALEAQRAAAPDDRGGAPAPGEERASNPVYEQLKLKAVEVKTEIELLERRVRAQEAVVERVESRAGLAPQIEAQYKALNRDYTVLKSNYAELLSRREQARLSQEMDSSADKVIRFRVIDPPEVPVQPSGPNKPLLATAVLVAGLGLGGAVAALLVYMSQSFGSPRQLRENFDLPVLGAVSVGMNAAARHGRRLSAVMFGSAVFGLLVTYALFITVFSGQLGRITDGLTGII